MKEHNAKKLVFILPYLYPGGAERALITLMNSLDRKKFSPELIVLKEGGGLRSLVKPDIKYHGLDCQNAITSYPSLLRKVKELKPDVIFSTMALSNFLVMALKPFLPATKFVIREAVVPSSILEKHKSKAIILKLLYKILYQQADCVVSPSQNIVEEFKTILKIDTSKHVVIHNQVDKKFILSKINKADKRANLDIMKFCCAGRLHRQKGYDRLISALTNFNPSFEWTLEIMGEGEERRNLEKMISSYSLEGKISLKGHQENPWQTIYEADIFLLPSRWEGMPNVVLESLACGTPVIGMSEASGMEEIENLSPDGAVTVVDSLVSFVNAMHKKPVNLKAEKQSLLADDFSQERITEKYEQLFGKI